MTETLVLAAGAEPLAGYRLVRLLGRGGFGEVWEATAPGEFHVALKFLRLGTRESDLEQRSLEVIRNIRHGHLLDVQFATRVADCLVIAMPLCDQSLKDRLSASQAEGRPGVPRNELLRYMDQLARAVDYLNEPRHRAEDGTLVGVQHRDIKPHNIFLVAGSVRLADFGLAKILAGTAASTQGSMSPSYAAPEVIGGHFSRWSDQYSVAATYCELRTGRPPFVGENALQIIYAHVHTPPDLSALPEAERPAVAQALAKRPEARWPTCRGFVRALIGATRKGDRRGASPAAKPAGPPGLAATLLPVTQVPPSVPPTLIDPASSSGVAPPFPELDAATQVGLIDPGSSSEIVPAWPELDAADQEELIDPGSFSEVAPGPMGPRSPWLLSRRTIRNSVSYPWQSHYRAVARTGDSQ